LQNALGRDLRVHAADFYTSDGHACGVIVPLAAETDQGNNDQYDGDGQDCNGYAP
jgi:hypothetical protein